MFWFIIGILLSLLIYFVFIHPLSYWTKYGVPQLSKLTTLNGYLELIRPTSTAGEKFISFYNQFPGKRYFGCYQFGQPILCLRDPELIRQITIKDFEHFTDHPTFIRDDIDPLWARNLFALTGNRWRDMRSTLSPVFTSSKIKQMFILFNENAEQFVQYFLKKNKEIITVEMKDIITRFTNDGIASTAFGLKIDSLEERENEFYLNGKEAVNLASLKRFFQTLLLLLLPSVAKIFKVRFFPKSVAYFFTHIIVENIKNREKNGIIRPDLLHLLMEARKRGLEVDEHESEEKPQIRKIELTDIDITAQALIFFFAGFDSVATLMSFMAYELAIHPDIQERLRQEVDDLAINTQGKPGYDDIQKMKYMDMVTSEALRKWPNLLIVDRACTKPYTIEPKHPDEPTIHIPKKMMIWLPLYPLHFDPEYFPEPERFDPERFSDENKENIVPYTYFPFGVGPRNCIGSRFALLETKVLFFHLLKNFELVPIEKTEIPIKLQKIKFGMEAVNGMWLGFKKRSSS